MNTKRNISYIILSLSLFISIACAIAMFAGLLMNFKDPMKSSLFYVSMYSWAGTSFVCMIGSLVILIRVVNSYKKQYSEYGIDFILENLKRERSALLMALLVSWMLFPIFPLINSYYKSGLSEAERGYAKHQIKVKRVDQLLNQKSVKTFLVSDRKANAVIQQTLMLREKKIDTEYNCNLYILKILDEINAPYQIIYGQKEVYYIGMNY